MSNQWFRMYADTITNPKLGCVTEALRWRYVALLCLHCQKKLVGRPDDEVCYALRVTPDELQETIKILIERDLLNPDRIPKGWDKRQFISDLQDPTAAERQKRYRDKKRNVRNDTVTSRPPESETDTESEKKEKIEKEKNRDEIFSEAELRQYRKQCPSMTDQEFRNEVGNCEIWMRAHGSKTPELTLSKWLQKAEAGKRKDRPARGTGVDVVALNRAAMGVEL